MSTALNWRLPRAAGVATSLIVSAGLWGCGPGADPAATGPQIPPPTVFVAEAVAAAIPNVVELPGRIESVRGVEVRARVDGIVERQLFQEGSDVAAGTPLFQIDPSDTKAALQQAQAALRRTEATRDNEAAIVNRFKPLVSRQAVSAQEFDAAMTALRQAEANVLDAQAAVTQARLRLERSTVRAPIAGRVGRALVSEGALVSASAATLLTQVNQLSPIAATFTYSNAAVLDFQQQIQSGAIQVPDPSRIEVRLVLPNGQEYEKSGVLDFTDLVVDPSTGSQAVRARFPNPNRTLLPGQFVRGRVLVGTSRQGVSVPARAVQFEGTAASIAVVGPDGVAARRAVTLGPQGEGSWHVRDGLQAGERVIVDGWQMLRPGQKVNAQPAPTAGTAPAPTAPTPTPAATGNKP